MFRYAIPLVAATALAGQAQAAEITIPANGPVVELTVTESVRGKPDIADIGAGVTTRAQTAQEAMRLNAAEMTSVIDKIKALGIASEDIQTAGINLNAQYDYDRNTQQQVFRGYQASNRVSVVLRDLDNMGAALDALVAAGATDLSGPSFSIDDDTAAKSAARKAAMARAKGQAMEYATAAGFSGLRLLEVNESIQARSPGPMLARAAVEEAVMSPTPIEPGLVGTSVTVTVKYEMTS